ncbi:MAG: hypothetical protein ACHBN1_02345 [Heteroscytonema crispum UTEX LB 1556]
MICGKQPTTNHQPPTSNHQPPTLRVHHRRHEGNPTAAPLHHQSPTNSAEPLRGSPVVNGGNPQDRAGEPPTNSAEPLKTKTAYLLETGGFFDAEF